MSKKKIGMFICALGITLECFTVAGCGIKETGTSSANMSSQETEVVRKTELPATENPLPTRNPMNVKENTLIFSCKTNEENTPKYDKRGGATCCDTFFVSDDVIFLDDSINQRILMYEKGKFVKSIDLEWNCDVKQMFFAKNENVLKVVYEDLSGEGSEYCSCDINIEDGRKTNDEKIEKGLIEYYYREDGKLMLSFLQEKATSKWKKIIKVLEKIEKGDWSFYTVFSNVEEDEYLFGYELGETKNGVTSCKRSMIRLENEQIVSYAVLPEEVVCTDEKRVKFINGNIYALVEAEDKIEIYVLAEKKISDNKVEFSERIVG